VVGLPVTTLVGAALTFGSVVFSLSGPATVKHRTTVVPQHPVAVLVTTGPFRFSRNPMYAGHVVSLIGAAFWIGTWWPIILAPVAVLATLRLVIGPEVEYLDRRFGAEYLGTSTNQGKPTWIPPLGRSCTATSSASWGWRVRCSPTSSSAAWSRW
jgi:protein-S-isoprenylcysteine O-methyltransferase Ste14